MDLASFEFGPFHLKFKAGSYQKGVSFSFQEKVYE
jgi:hypothetical protein